MPGSSSVGDLDGDGKSDLVVSNGTSNTLSVLHNTGSNGSISFDAKVDYITGNYPSNVSIGDLDGDGKPDLAVTNRVSNTVSILSNTSSNGSISFDAKVDYTTGNAPYNVSIGDLDGDGKPDLAVSNFNGNAVSVLRNIPFTPTITAFTPGNGGEGTEVTITGTHFTGATAVSFGGTAASSFTVINANTIVAVVGAGASGDVSVTTDGGTATESGFTYIGGTAPTDFSYASSTVNAIYGEEITAMNPTITGTVEAYSISPGLPAGLNLNSSTGEISGTPTETSGQTTYTVTAGNSYGSATCIISVTINKKALTITAEDKGKEYDGTVYNGGFTVVYNGFISGEDESVLEGALSFSGTSTTATSVGSYVITPEGLTSSNYEISYVNGTLKITGQGQTIAFSALSEKTYGDAAFNLTGTSSSGLQLSYTSSDEGVATISGNTVTIVGAGTTTITASQAGSANYPAASDVQQVLTVNKADQALTLEPLPVGSTPLKDFTGTIQVSASSSSGLPVTISLGTGSAATLNASDQLESIGETGYVIINVEQAGDANYNPASTSYSFDVVKSNQSIVFLALTGEVYSDGLIVDLSGTATASSGLDITYNVVSGPGTLNGTDLTVTGAGEIIISASQSGDAAWNAAEDITQLLTIDKATPVIVNFDDLTKTYGDAPLTFSASSESSGLFTYSSDNTDVAIVEGNKLIIAGVGSAVLTAEQDFDDNYTGATATATITVGKAVQSISFDVLADKTYGDAALNLAGIASSGLGVSYSSSDEGVATISGNTVTITGVGTTTITASQPGNANYAAATDVQQVLTVVAKALTVTAEDNSKEYDGAVYGEGYTAIYEGFVNGEDEMALDGILFFDGTAITATNAGSYEIIPEGLTSLNYDITFVEGTLDITQKALTITAEDKNKEYDGMVYSEGYTAIYEGFVNGENETVLEGTLSFDGTASTATNAGSYEIIPGGLTSTNYNIIFVPGTLDITQKALTITADDKSKEYDGTVYSEEFTVTYSGFITGETESILNGTLLFIGTAATATNAGSYVITPEGFTSSNYEISYINGTLEITGQGQTITFAALSDKTYGDADFNLTGTSSSGLGLSYSSSDEGVATISGNTVTIAGAGTTTITASQPGNGNYSAAEDVQQVLTVNKAEQIFTLDPLPVGSTPLKDFVGTIQVSASSSSGLPVTISLGTGSAATLNASNELESIGSTGSVVINVDQAGDANYNPASTSYSFDVVKSNQSIVFLALTGEVYSDGLIVDLSGTATASSGLDITYNVVSGPGTLNGTDLTVTGAGEIIISASQSGDAAWNAAEDITQLLTIDKATPVIVNFDDLTRIYGDVPLTLNASSESNGQFTYSSDDTDVAIVEGNKLIIVGVGLAVLTAEQDFDDNYTGATATATITVGNAGQSISFDVLADKTYGDAAFNLAGIASSGLGVSYSSSDEGVATISGNTVTITGAGTTTITASQSGNANYAAAADVQQVLTVVAKALTVTAEDNSKEYDGAVYSEGFTVVYEGFVNGEDETVLDGVLFFDGTAITATNAGSYEIIPEGLTSANYYITFVDGTLDITQRALTITAEDKNKEYDGTVYSEGFTATYSGFVAGENETVLDGTLSFVGTATNATDAGSYEIIPSGLTSSNYDISFVNGTLDITSKSLTVTADNQEKEYDGLVFSSFTVSYDGFVNGEDETSLGGSLSFTGTAATATNAGSYEIIPTGLTSSNYNISFVEGTLDITTKSLTVTADNQEKEYDGLVFGSFTVSYNGLVSGDDENDLGGELSFSGTATSSTNVGSYEIIPGGLTSTNYDIAFVEGTLGITRKALSITAENKSKEYDGAVYSEGFTVVYEGFVTGDDETVLDGILSFEGTATSSINVGSYEIIPGGLTSTNYDIAFVEGTLDIIQKTLTITAEDKTKEYDGTVYSEAFTVTYSGFITGEDETDLDGILSFVGNATNATDVGSYEIIPEGLTSFNYDISFVSGTLDITSKSLTVTADNQEKQYDGLVFSSFTVSYDGFVNGEDETSLDGGLSFTGTAATATNAGSYNIIPTGLTSPNYDISFISGTLDITSKSLTVTADDQEKEYDGLVFGSFTVSYNGFVSGDDETDLGGELSFSGIATTATNAGNYEIIPEGLTSANYDITFVEGTLDITQKALTITAEDKNKEYDGTVYSDGFTATYSGFVAGENETVLVGTLSFVGTATNATDAGNYEIIPVGLTSSNYDISFVNGTLDITSKSLTVIADDQEKEYDGLVFGSFTVSYNGLVSGDDENDLGGELSFSGTATSSTNVGSYEIIPGGLTSTNYDIAFVEGTLGITRKALSITAENKSKEYDGAVYSEGFTVVYEGLVNGDDETVLDGTLSFGGTSVTAINAGSYIITPKGFTSSNYEISFVDGTLDIIPKALTITAEDKTKEYDGVAYSGGFTVTYEGFITGETESILNGALLFSGTAVTAINAGSYVITPEGLTSSNYEIGYVDGTLDITQKALTITAEDKNNEYDGTVYSEGFTAIYDGFVNGDDETVLEGTLSFKGTAVTAINANSYEIIPTGLTSSNYDISFISGTLDITSKSLTVTADDQEKEYDGLVFGSFTVSYNGFVSGDDETDLGGELSFSGIATTATNAGNYEIIPEGLTSTNYDITYKNGTLVISKKSQTITFGPLDDRILGDADFELTGTASSGLEVTYNISNTDVATLSGDKVTIVGAGTTTITANQEGNENYLPAEPVTRALTVQNADATIQKLTINEINYENPENNIYYLVDCDDNSEIVIVSFVKDSNATATTADEFSIETPVPGIYQKTIQVTSQDGSQSEAYSLTVEKPFNFEDIVVQKFNNVLLVNNNPETNGGYSFTDYQWFKNGELVATGQYYSAGETSREELDPDAVYSVELKTEEGNILHICDFSVSLQATFSLSVSPNPASAGRVINVITDYTPLMLSDREIIISNLFGLPVYRQIISDNNSRITLPSALAPGTYIVRTIAGGVELSRKIIVQ